MPDNFDATGLTVETATEITAGLTTGLQGIYGADINVQSNSPDGQKIGIITQEGVDIRELLVQINASFDPDQAVGVTLDQRCAINGVVRVAGSYSIFPVSVTVNKTLPLAGLDANAASATGTGYTVTDGNGNNAILLDSTTLTAGTTTLNFRAQAIGAVNVPINTLTTPVTIVPGVTGVNNASAAISVGEDEMTDVQLRVLRQNSVANNSQGYLNGLKGALLALPGVIDAEVYENTASTPDSNGIPAYGMWAIVDGGANSDIAQTIMFKRGYSCPQKGSVVVDILSPSNVVVPCKFDRPTAENLFIQFTIKTTTAGFSFDTTNIADYIAANLSYEVGAFAETSEVTAIAAAAIASFGGGGVAVLIQISTDGATWTDYVTPTDPAHQFTIAAGNITITVV